MSQASKSFTDGNGAELIAFLNAAFGAQDTLNSGATEPTTMTPYMLWADMTSGYLKQRNSANTGWNILAKLNQDMIAALQTQLFTACTSIGVAPSFGITPAPALTAYAAGQRFRVKFHVDGAGSDTLNVNSLGAKSLKQYDATGTKVAAVIKSGMLTDVEYDGADMVVLDPLPSAVSSLGIASSAEAIAGTDNTKAITPLRLRNGLNASGSAPVYAARAWVNFNGTGTPAVRAGGNVSSITDNGTGDYTVNFTTAMPDADYAVSGNCFYTIGYTTAPGVQIHTLAASSARIVTARYADGPLDPSTVTLAFFR